MRKRDGITKLLSILRHKGLLHSCTKPNYTARKRISHTIRPEVEFGYNELSTYIHKTVRGQIIP
jgi:hypothetical protein